MSLFKKGVDIVRANLHDLLDEAEDPEKMLNLYLEDAKEGLEESKTALHLTVTSEKMLQEQWDQTEEDQKLWTARAETAAKKQKADLVQQAVNERRSAETHLNSLRGPLASAKADADKLKSQVEILEQKIEEASRNRFVLIARAKAAKGKKTSSDALAKVQASDPTSVIGSMEEKVARMEAEAEASEELTTSHRQNLEDQFRALESDDGSGGKTVDDEVAALLAKHAKPVTT